MGRVALQVVLQGAIFLGHGQFVVGQDEVVHADIAVARGGQLLYGVVQHFQLEFGTGQILGVDAPLGDEQLRAGARS